ncbi:MAG: dual specificity protein phosphatase family protein [Phyllobacteriaceae bacterium]|nr:dual specificity protein phosphatase family protein [Phyllobacteriaceae bacterium]
MKSLKFLLGAIAAVAVVVGGWFATIQITGNIHPVVPGVFYRSAQLSPEFLAETIARDHIATVVNLRGSHPADDWYRDEVGATAKAGATHLDFALSAGTEPGSDRIHALVELLRTAKKPVLVHCLQGADRSGLAAALFLRHVAGRDYADASRQLSIRYGHFPWLGSATVAMDHAFDHAEARDGSS